MKKAFIRILLSVNLLSVFVLSSFSTAKAESLTPGTTSTYGFYSAKTYRTGNSTGVSSVTVNIPFLSYELPVDGTGSCFNFHYQFNDTYTGYITLTITTNNSYKLNDCSFGVSGGWFSGMSAKTTSSSTKTFTIDFANCTELDFVIVRNNDVFTGGTFNDSTTFSYTFTIQGVDGELDYLQEQIQWLSNIYGDLSYIRDYSLPDMEDTFLNIYDRLGDIETINGQILEKAIYDKYFPLESFPLYLWAASYNNFAEYSNMDIPFVLWKTSTNSGDYTATHHIQIKNGTNDLYLLTNWALNPQRVNIYYRSDNGYVTSSFTQVVGWTNNLYVTKISFENTGGINYFEIELTSNCYVYPLWFTQDGHIPNHIALLLQTDYNDTYTDLLRQILQTLNTIASDEQYDTTPYDNFITDIGTFFTNLRNSFPSINLFQNDINGVPAFTGSNTHVDEMTGFVSDVYTGVSQAFPFVKTFIILGAVVLLMKVFL